MEAVSDGCICDHYGVYRGAIVGGFVVKIASNMVMGG